MCTGCDWEGLLDDIDMCLEEDKYEFAQDTLEGIQTWVAENEHCTDGQKSAVRNIMESQGSQIVSYVQSLPTYKRYVEKSRSIKTISNENRTLERRWVKMQRLIRTIDNVILEANLKTKSNKVINDYKMLNTLESGQL